MTVPALAPGLRNPGGGSVEATSEFDTIEFDGSIEALVDAQVVAVHPVHVEQPSCFNPELLLLIGLRRIDVPLPTGDPDDKLLVLPALSFIAGHGLPSLTTPALPGGLLQADCQLVP